jgi:hypothetical protein
MSFTIRLPLKLRLQPFEQTSGSLRKGYEQTEQNSAESWCEKLKNVREIRYLEVFVNGAPDKIRTFFDCILHIIQVRIEDFLVL